MAQTKRKTLSKTAKMLTAVCSLGGVFFSLLTAKTDGYSRWGSRLAYFTAQSNIWLGVTMLVLLLLPSERAGDKAEKIVYALKYIFTVSITLTGLVFCGLLAPFSQDGYKPWTFVNLLTHVFAPIFAVVDFFLDKKQPFITRKQTAACLLPPLFYCLFASLFASFGGDFGRGVPYPYFFLYYRSPAGFFGFSNQSPFFMGEFYWLTVLALVVYGIAGFYAHIRNRTQKRG